MSADDFRDYLNQQQQAQAAAQRLADITRSPEDEAADLERVVENDAREQIAMLAETADNLDDGYVEMVHDARGLRDRIEARDMTVDEAKAALRALRQRHGVIRHQVKQVEDSYTKARETAKNPGARRDELIEKYGL